MIRTKDQILEKLSPPPGPQASNPLAIMRSVQNNPINFLTKVAAEYGGTARFRAALFIAIQLYHKIWKRPEGSMSRQWFGSVSLLLALLLLTDDIAANIHQWTGLNNLSWCLGYLLGTVTLFFHAYSWADDDIYRHSRLLQRFIRVIVGVVIPLMAFLYLTQMMWATEWPPRTPRFWFELLFSLLFFGTGCIVSVFGFLTFMLAIKREQNPAVRARIKIASLLSLSAITCFVAKVIYLLLCFTYGGFEWVNRIALLAMGFTGLLFPILLISGKYNQWLVTHDPISFAKRLHTLYMLMQLEQHIHDLLPTVTRRQISRWYAICNPRLSIYRTVISILDGKKLLDSYILLAPEIREETKSVSWSNQQQRVAHRLHTFLKSVEALADEGASDIDIVAFELVGANQKMRLSTE